MNIRLVKGAGIISVQVWTEHLKGRPFSGWAVLVDLKDDGRFLGKPNTPELIALRREILAQV